MVRRSTQKRVQWKVDPALSRALPLWLYVPNVELEGRAWEHFEPHLYPGAMWQVNFNMTTKKDERRQQPPFPYLTLAYYAYEVAAPADAICTYLGAVRVTEENYKRQQVSTVRHTFLIGGQRYMTTDITAFRPVT